jgi:hypothetical protein
MNGFVSVSYEAFAKCIDLASGNPDTFTTLMLKRTGDYDDVTVTVKGKPQFSIHLSQKMSDHAAVYVDEYAKELESWF